MIFDNFNKYLDPDWIRPLGPYALSKLIGILFIYYVAIPLRLDNCHFELTNKIKRAL